MQRFKPGDKVKHITTLCTFIVHGYKDERLLLIPVKLNQFWMCNRDGYYPFQDKWFDLIKNRSINHLPGWL